MDLDFDVIATGFEMSAIDLLIGGSGESDKADELPEMNPDVPPLAQPGDVWQAGRHRLLCGDATKAESLATLMGGERAQMVFTDPPYNVPIDGHASGLGSAKHSDFAMASGEMSGGQMKARTSTQMGQSFKPNDHFDIGRR